MTAFVDTNVLIRHLTTDPLGLAQRATRYIASEGGLLVADIVVAETAYVLESSYEAPRGQVAEAIRSLMAYGSIICVDPSLIFRAAEVYESDRLDFASAYHVACAESTEVRRVASFDRSIGRIDNVWRVEPTRI